MASKWNAPASSSQVLKRSMVVDKERINASVIGIIGKYIGAIHSQGLNRPLVIEK